MRRTSATTSRRNAAPISWASVAPRSAPHFMASGDPEPGAAGDLVATEVQPRRREPVGQLAERRLQQRPRRRDAGVQDVVDEVLDADRAARVVRIDERRQRRQGGEAVAGQVDLRDQHDARALGASVPAGDVVGRVHDAVRRRRPTRPAAGTARPWPRHPPRSASSGKPGTGTRHASSSVRCRCNRLSPCHAATSTSHSTSAAGNARRARSMCRPRHPWRAADSPTGTGPSARRGPDQRGERPLGGEGRAGRDRHTVHRRRRCGRPRRPSDVVDGDGRPPAHRSASTPPGGTGAGGRRAPRPRPPSRRPRPTSSPPGRWLGRSARRPPAAPGRWRRPRRCRRRA